MLKVGKLINIEVIDHLVISEKDYISFEDEDIMDKLRNSGLFEIVEREKLKIKEWKLEMERDRAEKQKALDIAKKLKEEGIDTDLIKKVTGLNKWEIKEL